MTKTRSNGLSYWFFIRTEPAFVDNNIFHNQTHFFTWLINRFNKIFRKQTFFYLYFKIIINDSSSATCTNSASSFFKSDFN